MKGILIGDKFISIPIEIIRRLNWREKQKVVVTLRGRKITIKDWRK